MIGFTIRECLLVIIIILIHFGYVISEKRKCLMIPNICFNKLNGH